MAERIRQKQKEAPKQTPAKAPPHSAIPEPTTYLGSLARCYTNNGFYNNAGLPPPNSKSFDLADHYNSLWSGMSVPGYKRDFTEAAYIEKYGPLSGQEMYGMARKIARAAIPDNSSAGEFPMALVINTLSAFLFTEQITTNNLKELASDLDERSRAGALNAVNTRLAKLHIPMAIHTTQSGGMEGVCMKRNYK